MIRSSTIGVALAAALGLISSGASAQGVNIGVLECRGIGTTGFIIGSVQDIECVFRTSYMPPVRYHGVVRKWGVDVGVTEASVLAWGVFAPTDRIGPGDLAGTYPRVRAAPGGVPRGPPP